MTDDGNPPLGFVGTHYGAPQSWKDLRLEHAVSPQDVKYQFTGQAPTICPSARAGGELERSRRCHFSADGPPTASFISAPAFRLPPGAGNFSVLFQSTRRYDL